MRVLIVDDILTNRLLLSEIMKKLGIGYDMARDGKEALDALNIRNYDIVFMDIEMPVLNGLETTRFIRERLPYPKNRIPVVALTAHDPDLFFQDFKGVGFDRLMTKPYNIEKVAELLEAFR